MSSSDGEVKLPPKPLATWRIVGKWRDGREFLAVVGQSKDDCLTRLDDAMAEYTRDELAEMETLWAETWGMASQCWCPAALVPLRRLRIIAAAKERRLAKYP